MAEGIIADLKSEATIDNLYKLIEKKYNPDDEYFVYKWGDRLNMCIDDINGLFGEIGLNASIPFPFPKLRFS